MIARLLAAALMAVLTCIVAPSALAVLEVRPNAVAIDSEVDFVLRVHSVRAGTSTYAVAVRFPDKVTGASIAAPPVGWSMRALESDGRIVGVRYTGGVIPEGTHQDFLIRARTEVAGSSLWTAEQFYTSGEVVDFSLTPGQTGGSGQGAGAIVEIRGPTPAPEPSAPATPGAPREPEAPASEQPYAVVPQPDSGDGVGLLQGLGVTLLLIALAAFVAVLVLQRTRSDDAAEEPA
jgi:uncharacterized protein YcnI